MNTFQPPTNTVALWLIYAGLGLLWIRVGIEKILSGTFPQTLGKTLTYFASKNPYPWYRFILTNLSIPNSVALGHVVQFGELIAGVVLLFFSYAVLVHRPAAPIFSILFVLALLLAASFNMLFWLASAWTGPSTDDLNLFMFVIEVIGIGMVLFQLRLTNI